MTTPIPSISRKPASTPKERVSRPESATSGPVTSEKIRIRAYEIFIQRNGNGGQGDATSDWLQAERELNGCAPEPTASPEVEARSQSRGETLLGSGE
jgi:hypothetical protein